MPAFSFAELIKPATRADVQASIYRVFEILGVNTTAWEPGAVVRTEVTSVSAMMSAFSSLQASMARSGFLDLSVGDWLTLVAHYVYGVDRIDATFATGELTLSNSGGGVYDVGPDDLIAVNLSTGKTYRNDTSFHLGATSTITIPITATEAGSASNAGSGQINDLTTVLTGVTCSNANAVVGLDAESDAAVRVRCREKLGALSPMGPWDAYSYAARTAKRSTGEPAGVTRTRLTKDGFGNVDLYCASAAGVVTGTIGDLTTDLGAVDEAVQQLAAPLAVFAHTHSATAVSLHVVYELWAYNTSGKTDDEIKADVNAALIALTAVQPVGGNLLTPSDTTGHVFLEAIRAAISGALVPQIFHVVLTTPGSDLALTASQVAVLVHDPSGSDATVHQVPPPEGAAA